VARPFRTISGVTHSVRLASSTSIDRVAWSSTLDFAARQTWLHLTLESQSPSSGSTWAPTRLCGTSASNRSGAENRSIRWLSSRRKRWWFVTSRTTSMVGRPPLHDSVMQSVYDTFGRSPARFRVTQIVEQSTPAPRIPTPCATRCAQRSPRKAIWLDRSIAVAAGSVR
jgi:hypothetical protein